MNCCYGYAIDLLVELSKTVNFTYDLHLSEEEAYGSFERVCYILAQNVYWLLSPVNIKWRTQDGIGWNTLIVSGSSLIPVAIDSYCSLL